MFLENSDFEALEKLRLLSVLETQTLEKLKPPGVSKTQRTCCDSMDLPVYTFCIRMKNTSCKTDNKSS